MLSLSQSLCRRELARCSTFQSLLISVFVSGPRSIDEFTESFELTKGVFAKAVALNRPRAALKLIVLNPFVAGSRSCGMAGIACSKRSLVQLHARTTCSALGNEAVELTGGKQRRNAIITGDSFTNGLNVFLPTHFRRTLKIRPLVSFEDPFFQSIIEMEKPDVYIELVVDRHLANPPE